jgi:arsenate reductase
MTLAVSLCSNVIWRSQMAAGFLRHLAGDTVTVLAAGTEPAAAINPIAIQAMAEVGIDITTAIPALLDSRPPTPPM